MYGILVTFISFISDSHLFLQRVVIQSKSTECLSFPYIFMNFVVAAEWVLYGRLIADLYVQVSCLAYFGLIPPLT